MSLNVGDPLPDLTLPASDGTDISLRERGGRALVLYFYPKDNTPGCTQEGQDFASLHEEFQAAGADVMGVSRDSVKTHQGFAAKYGFPFPLLSDKDERLCQALGAIVEKSLYGRRYMGVDRSTYLFDAQGQLRQQWRKVKVKDHAAAVLQAVREL